MVFICDRSRNRDYIFIDSDTVPVSLCQRLLRFMGYGSNYEIAGLAHAIAWENQQDNPQQKFAQYLKPSGVSEQMVELLALVPAEEADTLFKAWDSEFFEMGDERSDLMAIKHKVRERRAA